MGNISKLTPILYEKNETDFNHNGLGRLTKLLKNEIDEALNGEFEALFEYPANGDLADDIDYEMFIKAKPNTKDEPHIFKIYDYELDTFTQTYLIYARSKNIEDLRSNVILDVNVNGLNPTQAWNQAKNNALGSVVTTFYSDITTPSSVHWEHRTLLSIIAGQQGSMIQYWGGEIKHGVDWVGLYRRRGQDNVTTVRYGKNLDGLKAVYSTKGLVTAIVPYFKKRDGQTIYGNVIESQYINNYPITYYDVVEYSSEDLGLSNEDEYNDNDIKNILNAKSSNYFSEYVGKDSPSINMEISLQDISQTKEYEKFKNFEQIELGDTITVYSHKYKINITAKVQRVVYNGLTDKNELVEVGTVRRSLYDDVREEFNRVEVSLQEGIDHAMASADGKNTIYHGTADPNEVGLVGKNNDTYFRTNGQFKEIWSYLDGQWHLEVGDLTGEQIKADIAEQQQDIEEAKQTADEAVEQIDTAVSNAGFTSLDDTIKSVQSRANTAFDTANDLIGEVSGYSQTVDGFNQTVNNYTNQVANFRSDVNGFSSTVTQYSSAVSGYATQVSTLTNEVSGFNSTVANIDGRVTTLNTTIDSISSTVSGHGDRITTVEQTAEGLQSTVASKASQSQVTQLATGLSSVVTDLSNLDIGGRNLVLNSSVLEASGLGAASGSLAEYQMINTGQSYMDLEDGEVITISFDIEMKIVTKNPTLQVHNSNRPGPVGIPNVAVGNQLQGDVGETINKRISFTTAAIRRESPAYSYNTLEFYSNYGSENLYRISKLKVERGNKATDWTPAPEDMATMDYTSSQISQLSDNINLRVAKGDIINQINISDENVLIESENILLDGDVTIQGTAWMDGAVIANASIDGAKIADATIGSAKIANLDVDKLSGNTGLWIRNEFNSINSTTSIDGSGLKITTTNTWDMRLGNSGIAFNGKNGALTGSLRAARSDTGDPEGTFLVAESDYLAGLAYRTASGSLSSALHVFGSSGNVSFSRMPYVDQQQLISTSGSSSYGSMRFSDGGLIAWGGVSFEATEIEVGSSSFKNADFYSEFLDKPRIIFSMEPESTATNSIKNYSVMESGYSTRTRASLRVVHSGLSNSRTGIYVSYVAFGRWRN